jgi:hypothetical protein
MRFQPIIRKTRGKSDMERSFLSRANNIGQYTALDLQKEAVNMLPQAT